MKSLTVVPSNTLSKEEARQLAKDEAAIEAGILTFKGIGAALDDINEKRLYRATHESFEVYTLEKWNISVNYAYRLINSAKVVHNLEELPVGEKMKLLPANEAQTRPLSALPPEKQVLAWKEAVTTTPEGQQPSAAHVETVAARFKSEPKPPKRTSAKPGWTTEEVNADEPLHAALYRIELALDKKLRKAIQGGELALNRAEVIAFGKLPDAEMAQVAALMQEKNWPPKKAQAALSGMVTERSTVTDLTLRCIAGGGSFEATVAGYQITVTRKGRK